MGLNKLRFKGIIEPGFNTVKDRELPNRQSEYFLNYQYILGASNQDPDSAQSF
jgi:hypothetical protein